jgi:hypothetical protein
MRMTAEHKRLYDGIDEILWNDWDPIGLNNTGPRDEYQAYTPVIFSLKIKGESEEAIAEKLCGLELATILGVPGNMDRCLQVARKIVELE